MTHSRLDLSYDVSVATRFMKGTHELQWKALKCILHYLQGTREFGIHYFAGAQLDPIGFIDSEWDGDSTEMKYTLGFVFMLGSRLIYWSSKKQEAVSLSLVEAEY